MALDFPTNPTDGQVYTSGNLFYQWKSSTNTWVSVDSITPIARAAFSNANNAGIVASAAFDAANAASGGSISQVYDQANTARNQANSAIQLPQIIKSIDYIIELTDGGKHILHPSSDTSERTYTIPANTTTPFAIGTTVTFINQSAAGKLIISIDTDTMRLAGLGNTGSRNLTSNGIATAIKLTNTEWIISGVNLT